jgi:hypothetical protein
MPDLKPFACTGCGALLALGTEPIARCQYCKKETKVPDEYGALQRAAKSFAADKQLAENLFGEVGKPPGFFTRAVFRGAEGSVSIGAKVGMVLLGIAYSQPIIGLGMFMAGAYLFGYPVGLLARAGYAISGHPAPKMISPYPVLAIATALVIVGFGIPVVLYGKERALAPIRAGIHGSLAATLPEKPGGPSRCRNCGAALDVPSGALGVPCVYCKADNLVALPQEWVTRVRGTEFQHFLQIDAGLEAFRLARESAKEKLWQLGFALVLVLPVTMVVAWLLDAAKIGF